MWFRRPVRPLPLPLQLHSARNVPEVYDPRGFGINLARKESGGGSAVMFDINPIAGCFSSREDGKCHLGLGQKVFRNRVNGWGSDFSGQIFELGAST